MISLWLSILFYSLFKPLPPSLSLSLSPFAPNVNEMVCSNTKQNTCHEYPLKWLGANYVRVLFDGWNENLFNKSAFLHSSILRFIHVLDARAHNIHLYSHSIWKKKNYAKKFYSTLISRSIFGLSSNVQVLWV